MGIFICIKKILMIDLADFLQGAVLLPAAQPDKAVKPLE